LIGATHIFYQRAGVNLVGVSSPVLGISEIMSLFVGISLFSRDPWETAGVKTGVFSLFIDFTSSEKRLGSQLGIAG